MTARLRNLAEKAAVLTTGLTYNVLSSTWVKGIDNTFGNSTHPLYSYREILSSVQNMLMRICTPAYEFCSLLVVPVPVSSAEADRSFSGLQRNKSSHVWWCLMSGCQDLPSCTYIMTLTMMLTKCVQSLEPNMHKRRIYASRIQVNGKQPKNYNVQPRLVEN